MGNDSQCQACALQSNQEEQEADPSMPWRVGDIVPCVVECETIDGKFQFTVSDYLRVLEAGQDETVLVENIETHQRGFVDWFVLAGSWRKPHQPHSCKLRAQLTVNVDVNIEDKLVSKELDDDGYIVPVPSAPVLDEDQDVDDDDVAKQPRLHKQDYLRPDMTYTHWSYGRCRSGAVAMSRSTETLLSPHSASSDSLTVRSCDATENEADECGTYTLQ